MLTHRTLEAWRHARQLTLAVSRASDRCWRMQHRAMWDQLHRAALSSQLNIAEGYALPSRRRLLSFLGIAFASAIEVGELIDLLSELGQLPTADQRELSELVSRTQALTLGLIKRYRSQLSRD